MFIYGVRIHDRETEDDPHLGTLMYSSSGPEGPWHDMMTGHPEWCWEAADALTVVNDMQVERQKQSEESLRAMLEEDRLEWPKDESDESDATQVAEETTEPHTHTTWDEVLSRDTRIKRMREAGDFLVECLEWSMEGREKPEDMLDAIAVWTEEYSDG
jgi:hypothetical protein